MVIKIILDGRRVLVHAFGWSLVDLELPARLPAPPEPASSGRPENPLPDRDPAGTLSSQVEQAAEPAAGFGFAGSVRTVMAHRDGP